MSTIHKQAIVPYTTEQMYRLVDDIPAYPQFLPWCRAAAEHERCAEFVMASLEVSRLGITKSFTTKNKLFPPHKIEVNLVRGPFTELRGQWEFAELGDSGSKIQLHLTYHTVGKWFDLAFAKLFDHIANTLVDAFCERARALYGK